MRPVNRQEVYDILESLSLNSKNILRIEEYSFSKVLQARYIARNQRRNLEYLLSVVNGDIVIICPLLILIENSWNKFTGCFRSFADAVYPVSQQFRGASVHRKLEEKRSSPCYYVASC